MESENTVPVCLVTGGSAGIGLETAKLFAENGYRVAICGRDENRLALAEQQLKKLVDSDSTRILAKRFDLRAASQAGLLAEEVRDRFGRIDVLVNNAGTAVCKPFAEMDNNDFESMVSLNIRAVHHLTHRVWPWMKQQGGGIIVNLSSLSALDPFPGFAAYGASKAWIDAYSKALATEGKPDNIRVYSIRPGVVDTDLLNRLFPDFPTDQRLKPIDVSRIIFATCTDAFKYCSGQAINIHKQ